MTHNDNKLTVVIVSYNPGELLFDCLDSLSKDESVKPNIAEYIVVDNGSNNGALEKVLLKYPYIRVIRNSENKGFAVAANQGYRAAKNNYILYVNTDVKIIDAAVSKLLNVMNQRPEAAVVGPRLFRRNMTVQKSVCPQPNIWNELFKPYFKLRTNIKELLYDKNKYYDVPSLRGAFFLIRKDALMSVGGFDERYFFSLEETDLFHRLRKEGWKIFYYPNARVIHYGGEGTKTETFNRKTMYRESLLKYFEKNRPRWETVILKKYWRFLGKI